MQKEIYSQNTVFLQIMHMQKERVSKQNIDREEEEDDDEEEATAVAAAAAVEAINEQKGERAQKINMRIPHSSPAARRLKKSTEAIISPVGQRACLP